MVDETKKLLWAEHFTSWSILLPPTHLTPSSPTPVSSYSPSSSKVCVPWAAPLLGPHAVSAMKSINSLYHHSDWHSWWQGGSLAFHHVQERISWGGTKCEVLLCFFIPMGPACTQRVHSTTHNLVKTCKGNGFSLTYNMLYTKKDILRQP